MVWGLLCLVIAQTLSISAEPLNSRPVLQKDFRVFDYYRGSQRMKALLRGGEAEYLLNPIPMRRVTIETYTETGLTNLVAKSDTSWCNRTNRTAYSAGPLEFRLSEGRFRLSGWGYHWSQTNTHLIVSNQVRSVLKGDLLSHPINRP